MKIRKHRGSLADSIETMQEIEPTIEAIAAYLNKDNTVPYSDQELKTLQLYPYGGKDDKLGWDKTYIVLIVGNAVAFTDHQCITEQQRQQIINQLKAHAYNNCSRSLEISPHCKATEPTDIAVYILKYIDVIIDTVNGKYLQ